MTIFMFLEYLAALFCYHRNGNSQKNTIYQFFTFKLLFLYTIQKKQMKSNFKILASEGCRNSPLMYIDIALWKGKSILGLIKYNINTALQIRVCTQKLILLYLNQNNVTYVVGTQKNRLN